MALFGRVEADFPYIKSFDVSLAHEFLNETMLKIIGTDEENAAPISGSARVTRLDLNLLTDRALDRDQWEYNAPNICLAFSYSDAKKSVSQNRSITMYVIFPSSSDEGRTPDAECRIGEVYWEGSWELKGFIIDGVADKIGLFLRIGSVKGQQQYQEWFDKHVFRINLDQTDGLGGSPESDWRRDYFDTMTDGQFGDYDDFSQQGGDVDDMDDLIGR